MNEVEKLLLKLGNERGNDGYQKWELHEAEFRAAFAALKLPFPWKPAPVAVLEQQRPRAI